MFDVLGDSKCADCGKDLLAREFLFMEGERPLCLSCADLDHLVYLHRGNTALTRRARKHSALSAVVVRFSRARKRYERQGVLVEEPALEQAEQECLADAAPTARGSLIRTLFVLCWNQPKRDFMSSARTYGTCEGSFSFWRK